MGTRFTLHRPGLVAYQDAWEMQRRIASDVRAGAPPALILLEHPPAYTLGVRGNEAHVLLGHAELAQRGATLIRSDRGGDVTFHGPGQIVGYPIIHLRARAQGPVAYVRAIEQTLIDALACFGVPGDRAPGRPGVWVGGAKIAAIGVRVSGGVTTHGFALNVNTDLSYFNGIIPCGIADAAVTSMEALLGAPVPMRAVEDAIIGAFSACFGMEPAGELAEVAVGR